MYLKLIIVRADWAPLAVKTVQARPQPELNSTLFSFNDTFAYVSAISVIDGSMSSIYCDFKFSLAKPLTILASLNKSCSTVC